MKYYAPPTLYAIIFIFLFSFFFFFRKKNDTLYKGRIYIFRVKNDDGYNEDDIRCDSKHERRPDIASRKRGH